LFANVVKTLDRSTRRALSPECRAFVVCFDEVMRGANPAAQMLVEQHLGGRYPVDFVLFAMSAS
jgi:hypothetical protein